MRILYIDIDSLRPDHLGCYGYHRNTSPHIDALAERGIRFDNVYVSDAPCMLSRMASWSGRCGFRLAPSITGERSPGRSQKVQLLVSAISLTLRTRRMSQLRCWGHTMATVYPSSEQHSDKTCPTVVEVHRPEIS